MQNYVSNSNWHKQTNCFFPTADSGQANSLTSVAGMEERTITIITPTKYGKDGSKSFTFNKVFGPAATQGI